MLYRDGEGFVIVYAVTSYTSFERVERFKEQVTRVKDSDKVPVVIVGNKCDVEDNLREVKADEAQAVAQKNGWKLMEASAKTCYNVEEPFFNVARMIRASQRQEEAPAAVDDTKTKKKGKCLLL
jgi:GTPase KRas protein